MMEQHELMWTKLNSRNHAQPFRQIGEQVVTIVIVGFLPWALSGFEVSVLRIYLAVCMVFLIYAVIAGLAWNAAAKAAVPAKQQKLKLAILIFEGQRSLFLLIVSIAFLAAAFILSHSDLFLRIGLVIYVMAALYCGLFYSQLHTGKISDLNTRIVRERVVFAIIGAVLIATVVVAAVKGIINLKAMMGYLVIGGFFGSVALLLLAASINFIVPLILALRQGYKQLD